MKNKIKFKAAAALEVQYDLEGLRRGDCSTNTKVVDATLEVSLGKGKVKMIEGKMYK
jgi:hypothetical protein